MQWIYAMTNAIASKKCQCGKAWEPRIKQAIAIAMVLTCSAFAQLPDNILPYSPEPQVVREIPDHYKIDSEVLRFRIYGKQWRVVLADMHSVTLCGQTEWKDRLIYIDRNAAESERPEILLHEFFHALMFEKFSSKKMTGHQFIYSVSPALQKALADNPDLVKYLVKK